MLGGSVALQPGQPGYFVYDRGFALFLVPHPEAVRIGLKGCLQRGTEQIDHQGLRSFVVPHLGNAIEYLAVAFAGEPETVVRTLFGPGREGYAVAQGDFAIADRD